MFCDPLPGEDQPGGSVGVGVRGERVGGGRSKGTNAWEEEEQIGNMCIKDEGLWAWRRYVCVCVGREGDGGVT